MPDHYPPSDEAADRLLPYRWQVVTIEDARVLVKAHLGTASEEVAQSLFRRRGIVQ